MNVLRYWYGRYLLRLGYCPKCNSSPPGLDCPICQGEREYGPFLSDLNRARWKRRWNDARRG